MAKVNKKWKPKYGERYWLILFPVAIQYEAGVRLCDTYNDNSDIDLVNIKANNCFRLKKDADAAMKLIKNILKSY